MYFLYVIFFLLSSLYGSIIFIFNKIYVSVRFIIIYLFNIIKIINYTYLLYWKLAKIRESAIVQIRKDIYDWKSDKSRDSGF